MLITNLPMSHYIYINYQENPQSFFYKKLQLWGFSYHMTHTHYYRRLTGYLITNMRNIYFHSEWPHVLPSLTGYLARNTDVPVLQRGNLNKRRVRYRMQYTRENPNITSSREISKMF